MTYRIALSGTFDVENYGDLLFPVIFERAMKKRGLDYELVLFSPDASLGVKAQDSDVAVYPLSQLEKMHLDKPFDTVVVGGGALIHYKSISVVMPGAPQGKFTPYRNSETWVTPALVCAKYGIKLLYNLPQVSYPFAKSMYPVVRAFFAPTDYISFRDAHSKMCFDEVYAGEESRPEMVVAPDSVCVISELIDGDSLAEIRRDLLPENTPYAVLHFNRVRPEGDTDDLLKTVAHLKALGLQVVLLPLGYTHFDEKGLDELNALTNGECIGFERPLSIMEMASVLAGCEIYIGSSFHGAVTALGYGKKAVSYNYSRLTKNAALFDDYGIGDMVALSAAELIEKIDLALSTPPDAERVSAVFAEVNAHFDRLFEHITSNSTPKSKNALCPESVLLDTLEVAATSLDQITACENEIARLSDEKVHLENRMRELETQLEDFRIHHVNTVQTITQDFTNSASWKITKPIRAVSKTFKKTEKRV